MFYWLNRVHMDLTLHDTAFTELLHETHGKIHSTSGLECSSICVLLLRVKKVSMVQQKEHWAVSQVSRIFVPAMPWFLASYIGIAGPQSPASKIWSFFLKFIISRSLLLKCRVFVHCVCSALKTVRIAP